MAPITDNQIDDLKDLVHKLESRVHDLERRLESGGKKPTPVESMRMILIGPPGAGMFSTAVVLDVFTKDLLLGKGTQAPRIKDRYCICHLVCLLCRKHLVWSHD